MKIDNHQGKHKNILRYNKQSPKNNKRETGKEEEGPGSTKVCKGSSTPTEGALVRLET